MMYWYGDGVGGWGYVLMTLTMVGIWVLLVAVGVVLVCSGGWTVHAAPPLRPTPEQVLAERFARGEIDDEEYRRRLAALPATTVRR